jgi:D-ribose pyranose/furanose isomerase RbsD
MVVAECRSFALATVCRLGIMNIAFSSHAAQTRRIHVPQEVIDQVIDYLHDNTKALRQCSLVCRSWLPSTSLHLFAQFSWPPCCYIWETYPYIQEGFLECRCPTCDYSAIWHQLHNFLQNSARVRDNIQFLRLAFQWLHRVPGSDSLNECEYHECPVALSDLKSILDLLPSLRQLFVSELNIESYTTLRQDSLPVKSLDRLVISCYGGSQVGGEGSDNCLLVLALFLGFFSNISTLTVVYLTEFLPDMHAIWMSAQNQLQLSTRCNVSTLQLFSPLPEAVPMFLDVLQLMADLDTLSTVVVPDYRYDPPYGVIESFFESVPNLTSFAFDAKLVVDLAKICQSCPKLSDITVETGLMLTVEEGVPWTDWAIALETFEGLLPSHMVHLRICLDVFGSLHFRDKIYTADARLRRVPAAIQLIDLALLDDVLSIFKTVDLEIKVDLYSIESSIHAQTLQIVKDMTKSAIPTRIANQLNLKVFSGMR